MCMECMDLELNLACLHEHYVTLRYYSMSFPPCKGANPQRVSTEIIIEIKQLYSGRMASNPFIASKRRYMVFPLRDLLFFFIENGL